RRQGAAITFVSSYVYGIPDCLPITEAHPTCPLNPYSHTKILAEDSVKYYQSQFGVRATIVRPFNVYGPGQGIAFLIPKLIRQVIDPAVPELVLDDLRPRRDYFYIRDLIRLLTMTLSGNHPSAFNAGSGESFSICDLIDTISLLTGIRKTVRSLGKE